jgi:hypothetical protein
VSGRKVVPELVCALWRSDESLAPGGIKPRSLENPVHSLVPVIGIRSPYVHFTYRVGDLAQEKKL